MSGGDHRAAFRIDTSAGAVFLKCTHGDEGFAAEAAGLRALGDVGALRVPAVLAEGCFEGTSILALEWLELGSATRACEARLGTGLAELHGSSATHFGWNQDNTIGATPQRNHWHHDWIRFFAERRLGAQLELARTNGAVSRLVERGNSLLELIAGLFAGYRPQPSLLHGDLWSGNWSADRTDQPVIFDPAVYYGDREVDLAMSRLFGGFGPAFYAAYEHAWPLDAGAAARVTLYNLYHVLNHFNLFGGAYQARALRMVDELLALLKA